MSMVIFKACLKLHIIIYPNRLVPFAGIELATFSLRMNSPSN